VAVVEVGEVSQPLAVILDQKGELEVGLLLEMIFPLLVQV
jgi:hypothetical protein